MIDILRFEQRPFKDIEDMNSYLLNSCRSKTTMNDVIIHVGDLASFKSDRGQKGLDVNPMSLVNAFDASFINIRGNHDIYNHVKSVADSMRMHLNKRFPNVSVSHYPSYDPRCVGNFFDGDIHLCGHVHSLWKHCLDLDHSVLNINVGVDVWNYEIVSEQDLTNYINKVLNYSKDRLNKIKTINGKLVYV